jgi:outer membrane protein, multidrug efflux system
MKMPELNERTATAVPQPHRKCLRATILLVAAVTGATATGCLVGPNYQLPFLQLPARWSGVDEVAKQTSGEGPKTDLAQWWRSFNDPVLNELIAQALSSNLDEKIAVSRIHEERDYPVMSRAWLFPSVDLSGAYTRQRYSANTSFGEFPEVIPREQNMYEAGFDASWNWMSLAASGAEWKPRRLSSTRRSRTHATYG